MTLSVVLAAFNNLDEFDKAVNPDLAGTLAGLSLAAATFLISFRVNVADRIRRIRDDGGSPAEEDVAMLRTMDAAVRDLVISFYVFVVLLSESLTLDNWAEPHALMSGQRSWLLPTDVALTAVTLTSGIVLLGLGARRVFSVASTRKPRSSD